MNKIISTFAATTAISMMSCNIVEEPQEITPSLIDDSIGISSQSYSSFESPSSSAVLDQSSSSAIPTPSSSSAIPLIQSSSSNSSSSQTISCSDELFADNNTIAFFDFENDPSFTAPGKCGNGVRITTSSSYTLGKLINSEMPIGTVEFYFKPDQGFFAATSRTILGNDGARIHFYYSNGYLVFQKNRDNEHHYVKVPIQLDTNWIYIAGQWNGTKMSIYLDGQLAGEIDDASGYQPSPRWESENIFVLGEKTSCCMEGPGQYSAMRGSGSYDMIRISSIARFGSIENNLIAGYNFDKDENALAGIITDETGIYPTQLASTVLWNYDQGVLFVDSSSTQSFPFPMDTVMPTGRLKLDFSPGLNWNTQGIYSIAGNDEARLHIVYNDGVVYFQKNHDNIHIYTSLSISMQPSESYSIEAAWDETSMTLMVNGVSSTKNLSSSLSFYQPSSRSENGFIIGGKSSCCMEGIGIYAPIPSYGYYDNLRFYSK